jgi:alkaline phosphatase D
MSQYQPRRSSLDRRHFLQYTWRTVGASLALALLPGHGLRATPRFGSNPFTLGVASGDPTPNGIVLWTRLVPDPTDPHSLGQASVPVRWRIATDDRLHQIVRHGVAVAHPQLAHSVHVEVHSLSSRRDYFYQFDVGGNESPIGHFRLTVPKDGGVGHLRFACAACQDFQDGFYTAYEHLAREDLDFVVFLGDYIYEDEPDPLGVRQHTGAGEPVTVDEYRARYALYRSDPALQAAHAACPWAVTFDDHEVDNDWSGDTPQDPDEQLLEAFRARRAAAFQAYYEHMPLRTGQRSHGASIRIHRRLQFGTLLDVYLLDTRQYRSLTEPCGYGTGPLCSAVLDPARTMLGAEQEHWLFAGLARSHTRWNVLAQQVPVTRLDVGGPGVPAYKLDKWDAYPVARERLLRFLGAARVRNPVVLTGDLHDAWVAHLQPDFDDPASPVVASEFVGTSISSDGDGTEASKDGLAVAANGRNPHIIFHNNRRGYAVCEVSQREWRTHFRIVPFVRAPGAPLATRASFVIEDGQPAAQPA